MADKPHIQTSEEALLALAERVDAAAGPDRELDADIAMAVLGYTRKIEHWLYRADATGRDRGTCNFPAYTSSLDAAMTLVPGGWDALGLQRFDDGSWDASLAGNDAHLMGEDPDEFYVNATAATPALAMTAACLRARASGEPQ